MRVARAIAFAALAAGPACNCGLEVLEVPKPRMIVRPEEVSLTGIPVAQDTKVVIQVHDPSIVNLTGVVAALNEGHDPGFRLNEPIIDEVLAGQTGEITVVVRPVVATTIKATLIISAAEPARPNRVEVPITVQAVNAGLPDICEYPDPEEGIRFDSVGQNDVARFPLNFSNCGTRDLIIDEILLCDDDALPTGGDGSADSFRVACTHDEVFNVTPVPPGFAMHQGQSAGTEIVFHPTDLLEHTTNLCILSNDPDETPLCIPMSGTGAACPTACIDVIDGVEGIEPFDTVRLDGTCSTVPEGAQTLIEQYQWTAFQRPLGSQAVLTSLTAEHVELPVDIAGAYEVHLDVFDNEGVRSCVPFISRFQVVPNEDLHLQLVWDHPTADLDLHLVGDGGTVFTHGSDCYFSNRHPGPLDCPDDGSVCSWVADADDPQNPDLDHDDNDGVGPENINVVHPAPNSHWRVLVHYWDKRTDGDALTHATLRVFVYGQQVMEVPFTFEDDEVIWEAVDIVWPEVQGDPANLAPINTTSPFPRPFGG